MNGGPLQAAGWVGLVLLPGRSLGPRPPAWREAPGAVARWPILGEVSSDSEGTARRCRGRRWNCPSSRRLTPFLPRWSQEGGDLLLPRRGVAFSRAHLLLSNCFAQSLRPARGLSSDPEARSARSPGRAAGALVPLARDCLPGPVLWGEPRTSAPRLPPVGEPLAPCEEHGAGSPRKSQGGTAGAVRLTVGSKVET